MQRLSRFLDMPNFEKFRTRLRDVIKPAYHYNTEAHAETLTYTTVGGSPSQVTAHCEFERSLEVDDHTEEAVEELRVRVRKTEVPQPNIGDQVLRAVANDASQLPFIFDGTIEDESRNEYRLIFKRYRRQAQGFK